MEERNSKIHVLLSNEKMTLTYFNLQTKSSTNLAEMVICTTNIKFSIENMVCFSANEKPDILLKVFFH